MKNIRTIKLKKFVVYMSLYCASFSLSAQEHILYLKNTGNETISAAYAYSHYKGFTNERDTLYGGWISIKPGERKYIGTMTLNYEAISFAFAKRDGYIKYITETSSGNIFNEKPDSIYVDTAESFKYTNNPPSSLIPIPISFEISSKIGFGYKLELYQTIDIASNLTDRVIPWKVPGDGNPKSSKPKKTTAELLKEIEASSSLAPLGTYKTKKGYSLEFNPESIGHGVGIQSYIKKTNITVKKGELLFIKLHDSLRMRPEVIDQAPENLNEYEAGNKVKNALKGSIYVRIGNGRWKLVEKKVN